MVSRLIATFFQQLIFCFWKFFFFIFIHVCISSQYKIQMSPIQNSCGTNLTTVLLIKTYPHRGADSIVEAGNA